MTTYLFENNAQGTLAADISALATTLSLGTGEGSLFPSPVTGEAFRITLQSGTDQEIVECTSRSGDVLTIARAKEGTTARAWSAGALVQLRLTKAVLESMRDGGNARQALDGVTPAADKGFYFTGASAGGLFDLTSFARSLLASASAAAWRTLLGVASLTGTETLTNKTLTSPDINGGTLDGAPVGASSPSTGAFTTLSASGAVNFLPTGIICMWSGAVAAVPSGWALCDGTNGTPDLRNKFIIGAGVDNAGVSNTTVTGSNTKSGGSKDAVAVSHSHTATTTITDPGHAHDGSTRDQANGYQSGSIAQGGLGSRGTYTTSTETTGITAATTVASNGVSGTDANLPPYYALAFIMRL